jgi:hypothetical protein
MFAWNATPRVRKPPRKQLEGRLEKGGSSSKAYYAKQVGRGFVFSFVHAWMTAMQKGLEFTQQETNLSAMHV